MPITGTVTFYLHGAHGTYLTDFVGTSEQASRKAQQLANTREEGVTVRYGKVDLITIYPNTVVSSVELSYDLAVAQVLAKAAADVVETAEHVTFRGYTPAGNLWETKMVKSKPVAHVATCPHCGQMDLAREVTYRALPSQAKTDTQQGLHALPSGVVPPKLSYVKVIGSRDVWTVVVRRDTQLGLAKGRLTSAQVDGLRETGYALTWADHVRCVRV